MALNRNSLLFDYTNKGGPLATASVTDLERLRQVAARDEQAFAELYQHYSRPLYNYLLRLVHEPPVAEDLLQEVFVAVWQGAGAFRGGAQVRTWLYRIAHHQAVSWLRRRRSEAEFDGRPEAPAGDDPSEQAMAQWRAEQVRHALDNLSPEHRAVLELTFYHGFSYAEVAAIVGCPLGTVKSRMSYARRYAIEALKQLGVAGW